MNTLLNYPILEDYQTINTVWLKWGVAIIIASVILFMWVTTTVALSSLDTSFVYPQ